MAEHTLILLRHSNSDWPGDEADIDRPLAKRGRRQAPGGRPVADHPRRPDRHGGCLTAERARATWDLVSAEFGERPITRQDEDAYAASAVGLLDIISSLGEELRTVVRVGHNLELEGLAERLIGDRVPLPTSALAVIDLDGPGGPRSSLWAAGRGARPGAHHPRTAPVASGTLRSAANCCVPSA